ncbi:MAG: transglutaminase-like domain-containing protein [Bacteroidia bacterium]|nr:transglutaminase-like domain-containing protein [Bacteroidia bacterium]
MKSICRILIVSPLFFLFGCSGEHLITNEVYRNRVDSCFKQTEILAKYRQKALFSVFESDLSLMQSEALKFLFAFMPLNDLADYTGSFFLANADRSLAAREETSWGSSIPEDLFLHYVLPVRVNNENLDSFRIVYYDEIMSRIKNKTIADAALEINHWCHEKVTYQPSDSRTSAPMSTILSARGRCGEESTFTVAALRVAGIPARQVSTPRWAHSDDNHAWVEFWADGAWYYMGACEPEAVPDRGWFTEPARRAMLVNTKSFGASSGSENVMNSFGKYSEVNNLSKYAVTKRIYVKAVNSSGIPLKRAAIEYQLYNYAEFYPLATVLTDHNGISSFETGLGDLLIWGRKDDDFGFKKISVLETDTVELELKKHSLDSLTIDLDLSVPVKRAPQAGPSKSLSEANDAKIKNENSIRQEFIDTWIKRSEAVNLASGLAMDTVLVADALARSMGNYRTIISLLKNVPDTLRSRTISMLKVVADKDLRDTRELVFSDHILNSDNLGICQEGDPLFIPYVLNPRISNEILSPWRRYFQTILPADFINDAIADPEKIVTLLDTSITIADMENYAKTPVTPSGVWELKLSDVKSITICFVAICRSLGIASRLEPGSNVPQYWINDNWHDVYFTGQDKPSTHKGYIRFTSKDKNPVPEYYIHFTLARFENGRYNTLEYNENTKVNDFKDELQLSPGNYMLVTGNRLNDSKILANISFFKLAGEEHKTIAIKLRRDQ